MGISGKNGRVYMLGECYDGGMSSSSGSGSPSQAHVTDLHDEVTRFVINDTVNTRKYAHDKSHGWQVTVPGVRGIQITVDAMANQEGLGAGIMPNPGQSVFLTLEPFGSLCKQPVSGYAIIDSVAYTTDIETGNPVSYTMVCSSNGKWEGLGHVDAAQCECSLAGP